MIPYWILFSIPAWLAIKSRRPKITGSHRWSDYWKIMFLMLVLMVGFRHEVGGDWFTYMGYVGRAATHSFIEIFVLGDPAYELLNWLGSRLGGGVFFVNSISAAFFIWGVIEFCRRQPRAWLALTVAIPYLVIVVGMGYTRQAAAIGLAMLGLVALADRHLLRFALFIALAAAFHKSAVILMPLGALGFFSVKRGRWVSLVIIGLFSFLLYWVFLQDAIDGLQYGYLEAEYQSGGAAIRIAMNALPAGLFLFFRSRFRLSSEENAFWTWMSLIALGFVVLLQVSPSSTAVDRVALYLIPIQLFVLSRIPEAFGRFSGRRNDIWVIAVIAYSALVQFIWLFFAAHADYWLPYQFLPWVWLTQ